MTPGLSGEQDVTNVLEGELLFELEGAAPRVVKAGETFWEPGGDVLHYSRRDRRVPQAS